MNPSSDKFNVIKFKEYVLFLEKAYNMNPGEARKEALEIAIFNVAMLNKAKEFNIVVTDEEALIMAHKQRELLKDKNHNGAIESLQYIQNLIDGLGITEEEYWNEYAINSYKELILIEKLFENVTDGSKDKHTTWNILTEETIEDFKGKNHSKINQFKKEIGM